MWSGPNNRDTIRLVRWDEGTLWLDQGSQSRCQGYGKKKQTEASLHSRSMRTTREKGWYLVSVHNPGTEWERPGTEMGPMCCSGSQELLPAECYGGRGSLKGSIYPENEGSLSWWAHTEQDGLYPTCTRPSMLIFLNCFRAGWVSAGTRNPGDFLTFPALFPQGRHKCECKSHYVGDGLDCEPEQLPLDRCLQDNGQCHPDASCADLHFQGQCGWSPSPMHLSLWARVRGVCRGEKES